MKRTEIVFCGQAPSRIGDGRPFTGPSGQRLVELLGLEDYEALARQFTLTNIFLSPAERLVRSPRTSYRAVGDGFDTHQASLVGRQMMLRWAKLPHHVVVVACGQKVTRALLGRTLDRYQGVPIKLGPAQGVDVWHFPHPSGASKYWNDPENIQEAALFLKRLLSHYGITITK